MEKRRLLVLYGSQTFTAQEIAERIWRQTKLLGFTGPVQAMDDYNIANLIHENFVIFVCATAGQGEEPDNMKNFWKFLLRKNLPHNSLRVLNFAVLALGDSSFSKFNWTGKKLHKRLMQLGASPLIDIGLCDDQHDLGHDAVMEPWLEKLWKELCNFFPHIKSANKFENSNQFTPRWKVTLIKDAVEDFNKNKKHPSNDIYFHEKQHFGFMEPKHVEVISNLRTTSEDHFQDVRLLSFKMKNGSEFKYIPGDVFNLRPRNLRDRIDKLFHILQKHNIDVKPHYKLKVEEYHDVERQMKARPDAKQ